MVLRKMMIDQYLLYFLAAMEFRPLGMPAKLCSCAVCIIVSGHGHIVIAD